jgi:predicted DNA-binding protein (MmcQ/YjbR family)
MARLTRRNNAVTQRYDPNHKTVLDKMMLGLPGVEAGQMFGYPSYKIGGKVFASLMEDGVAIKLPDEGVKALLEHDNVTPFTRMGRTMRQWVLVSVDDAAELDSYRPYFEQALAFVAAEFAT